MRNWLVIMCLISFAEMIGGALLAVAGIGSQIDKLSGLGLGFSIAGTIMFLLTSTAEHKFQR